MTSKRTWYVFVLSVILYFYLGIPLKIYKDIYKVFRNKYITTSNLFNYVFSYVVNNSVPIPTHYFVVLTSCKDKRYTPDACPGWLDVLPFIIPHRPTNVESCPVSMFPETPWDLRKWLLRAHLGSHKSGSDYNNIFFRCFMGRVVLKITSFESFFVDYWSLCN